MSFGRTFWACFAAFVAASVVCFVFNIIVFFSIIGALASFDSSSSSPELKENSVLKIDLDQQFVENPAASPFDMLDFQTLKFNKSTDIISALNAIKAAADDSMIDGIVLSTGTGTLSWDHAYLLRKALEDFHAKSEKFILAYGDGYSQIDYWLCTVADNIYVNPQGAVEWFGLSSQLMYFKDALDKLGVEAQIFRVGKFKSAVEPYMRSDMSPENRLQYQQMLNSIWNTLVGDVSTAREIEPELLNRYAESLEIVGPEDALSRSMVDSLVYLNDFNDYVATLVSADKASDINFMDLDSYAKMKSLENYNYSASKIAVLVTEGEMVIEESSSGSVIVGQSLADQIDEIRADSSIKAVVLRINSPGGSVLAAATAYNSMLKLKNVKPVVVSMGEYAASGGYYVSAPADAIVASPVTLTGSIGVFGVIFNVGKAVKQILGVNVESVSTHSNSSMTLLASLNPAQKEMMQKSVEKVYREFVTLVSDGRGMPYDRVDEIAGGRVWTGSQALGIGLVDKIGTLDDAVELAAQKAGLDNYRISVYPKKRDDFSAAFSELMSAKVRSVLAGDMASETILKIREQLMEKSGIQASMPYIIEIR